MVEGSCPFRRRSEELAADVRLLGDGSPELYPESLIVRAAQKERGIWFNILLLNEIEACHEQKTAVCLSERERERCFNNLFQTRHKNIPNIKMFIEERYDNRFY